MRFALSPGERRVGDLVRLLDRDEIPVAETWRQVGEAMRRLDQERPSYGHVRRLVLLERRRRRLRREARTILIGAAELNAVGRVPNFARLLVDLSELREEEELVFQEHKAYRRA